MKIGAIQGENKKYDFVFWAPLCEKAELNITGPSPAVIKMRGFEKGYWKAEEIDVKEGASYFFRINGENDRPDPASHSQPEGVHGPSRVIAHENFKWEDSDFNSPDFESWVIYEIHTGTFTQKGNFYSAAEKIPYLKELGVNAVEIMPVARFPGERNWGYDGVYPFAVQDSYGGPYGLKHFVNECHKNNIAVILDVVYNHLGPEGNYTGQYAPYFTSKYRTPWGDAVNFDDPMSDEVRNFFIENALFWLEKYHFDGLRLDAVHAIYDMSAKHMLKEMAEKTRKLGERTGKKYRLIAESDLNDIKLINPAEKGGYTLDAQWCDDFHHSIHSFFTGEKNGYYADFGETKDMAKAMENGFVYDGVYSKFRQRTYGGKTGGYRGPSFISCIQNHDQVGNRMLGERLSSLIAFNDYKLASGMLLLSGFIPLIFMGQEYFEKAPFLYFVSHNDPSLIDAVRMGRRAEFESFEWKGEPPDPQSEETFRKSKLTWGIEKGGEKGEMFEFYKNLIKLRNAHPVLYASSAPPPEVKTQKELIFYGRKYGDDDIIILYNTGKCPVSREQDAAGDYRVIFDSDTGKYDINKQAANSGKLPPKSFRVFLRRK